MAWPSTKGARFAFWEAGGAFACVTHGDGVPSGVGGMVTVVLGDDVTVGLVVAVVEVVGAVVVLVGTEVVERCGRLYGNLGSMS